jgi:hypothetical protein
MLDGELDVKLHRSSTSCFRRATELQQFKNSKQKKMKELKTGHSWMARHEREQLQRKYSTYWTCREDLTNSDGLLFKSSKRPRSSDNERRRNNEAHMGIVKNVKNKQGMICSGQARLNRSKML